MAEAMVEEPETARYYCHLCKREILLSSAEFICPVCTNGFVEQIPNSVPANNATSRNSNNASTSGSGQRLNSQAGLHFFNDFQRSLNMLRGGVGNGQAFEFTVNPNNRSNQSFFLPIGNTQTATASGGGNTSGGSSNSSIGSAGGTNTRLRGRNMDRFDNVLMDFLQNLTNADIEGVNVDNPRLLYMGNFGDYAWGLEGIDTIVTQLLNQMETAGPPPMGKDKIKELPTVEVGDEEIEQKLQCSVCWEDFQLKESVRKLPCAHLYHENCIVPWLELHGTCPICRKLLVEDNTQVGAGGQPGFTSIEDVSRLQAALNRNRSNTLLSTGNSGTTANEANAQPGQRQATNSATPTTATSTNAGTPSNVPIASLSSNRQADNRQQNDNPTFTFDNSNMELD